MPTCRRKYMDVLYDISWDLTNTMNVVKINIPYMFSNVLIGLYSCSLNIMDAPKVTFNNMKDKHMDVMIDAKKNNRCTVHVLKQMRAPKMMPFLTFPTHS